MMTGISIIVALSHNRNNMVAMGVLFSGVGCTRPGLVAILSAGVHSLEAGIRAHENLKQFVFSWRAAIS